jgi:hypothetical protein
LALVLWRPPRGSSLKASTNYVLSGGGLSCPRKSPISTSTLGGEPASLFTFTCWDGSRLGIGVDAIHKHGGYFMVLESYGRSLSAPLRQEFDTVRRSFHFGS